MLTFRNLRPAEATPALFAGFIRRQVVVDCWRWENGGWTIRPDPFIDDWSAADIAALAAGLRRTLAAGGFVRAAFCGAQLKGFAAAAAQPCGAQGGIHRPARAARLGRLARPGRRHGAVCRSRRLGPRARRAKALYLGPLGRRDPGVLPRPGLHRRRLAPPRPHRRRTLRLPAGIRPAGGGQSLIAEHTKQLSRALRHRMKSHALFVCARQ